MAPGCLKQTQGDRIPENPEFVTARTESGSSSTGGEERKGEKEALRSGAQSSVGERRGRHARGRAGPLARPRGLGHAHEGGESGVRLGSFPFFSFFLFFLFLKHFPNRI